jgi:hypothetical protein
VNLEATVRSIARRLRLIGAAEAAVRWCFAASVAAFLALVAAAFGAAPFGWAAAVGLAAGAALAGAAAGALAGPDAAGTARRLDRRLGLEERISTALEARGLFAELQRADAARALAAADRRRAVGFALSTEGRLLPLLLALCAGALLARPARPVESDAPEAPTAAHLEALGWLRPVARAGGGDLEKRLAALSEKIARGASPIDALDAVAREAEAKLAGGGVGAEEARLLRELSRGARGAAAALGRTEAGRPARPWDLAGPADPALEETFGERARRRAAAARGGDGSAAPGSSGPALTPGAAEAQRRAPRPTGAAYDRIIRRYFGE